ncbi:MAG: HlyD family efflux transporter periplasmic adaptor subunit [Christensenellales bacterium]
MARRKRRRPTKRFFITIAVLACVVMLVVFLLLQGPSEALITEGNLFVDKSVETLIVRDEKVYNSDNYSTATFFASEGQNVTKGATIAQVYKWGYNEKLMTDYLTTQQEIQDYQENTIWREVVNKDLNTNNGKINNTIQEIVDVVQGNSTSDLVVLERSCARREGARNQCAGG